MNKYHPNINLTVEVNPPKFLDTKIYRDNNEIKCIAYHKEMKLPSIGPLLYQNTARRKLLLETYITLSTLVLTFNRKLK